MFSDGDVDGEIPFLLLGGNREIATLDFSKGHGYVD